MVAVEAFLTTRSRRTASPPLNSSVRRDEGCCVELTNFEQYQDLCAEFQTQWVALLRDTLRKHGIADASGKSICGDFSFDLSMLFDQGELEYNGASYRPIIAFTVDDEGAEVVLRTDGPEFHEYAFGTTADAYDPDA
jgi:hypothetical protein